MVQPNLTKSKERDRGRRMEVRINFLAGDERGWVNLKRLSFSYTQTSYQRT